MKLHELSPSEGSKKKAFRVGRGHGSGNGKTSGKGQKVKKLVAAAVFVPALKADRCLSTEDFQNVALQIFLQRSTHQSMLKISTSLITVLRLQRKFLKRTALSKRLMMA